MIDELNGLKAQLEKQKSKLSIAANAAERAKLKPGIDDLTAKIANQEKTLATANTEIDRAFGEYGKVLAFNPEDRAVLSEMATNYYNYKRYDLAAKTWTKLIDPSKDNTDDLMRIGRAFYTGEKFKTADSVFNIVLLKNPAYVPALLMTARTYSKMDPDLKLGIARTKFEKLVDVSKTDSLKNESEMMEAFGYLSYYHMMNNNFERSKDYYSRMVNLNPNSKENKIKGYVGIGSVELRATSTEKTNEGRLPYLSRATDAFNKILAIDPMNAQAKGQIAYIKEFEAAIKKGINPNEIKGTVKNAAGQGIAYASIRVKDTAAESLSNAKGEFKFEIPQGSETLIVGAKGYKSEEIPITKSRVYNITLEQ
jgi:tetratricopeptide (TPR) repeat protein